MKNTHKFLLLCAIAFVSVQLSAQIPAFPGAEGFGKLAKGARASSSPTIYHVSNLNNSGTGSLRDAISQSNRIIVFDVAGIINISSRLVFSSNLYVAGQTAPGEGITVYGNGVSFSGADNLIVRYLRIRMGINGDSGKDAAGVANGSNMIFDHVSISWGRDETFSISGDNPSNITIQNSIISQGLLSHSAGGLIQTGGGVTLYRNLYVDNDTRNNKIKGVNQYVNNMVYNWKSGAYIMGGDSEGESFANCESNYFINGPFDATAALSGANAQYHVYAADNWNDKNKNGIFDGYLVPNSEYGGGPDFQTQPYAYPVLPKWSASQLRDSLLPIVGASLPHRDILDYYVIDELKSYGKKGKFISNESENSVGIPTAWAYFKGTAKTDTDKDGIPDAWETANQLNPNLASDALSTATNGYLNIENYINSLTEADSQKYLRSPLVLKTDSSTQNKVYVSWFDFTEYEKGFAVERWNGTAYAEIARTGINENHFTLDGLVPEEAVKLRIRAFNNEGYSEYSNEIATKSKPVPVEVLDISSFTPDKWWTGNVNSSWDYTTKNWNNGDSLFTDSANILIANSANMNIELNQKVISGHILVMNDFNVNITGTGSISGNGSMNKTGKGMLELLTINDYKGATVIHDGELKINSLANGGSASSIGASSNYDFNLVLLGGRLNYAGPSVATDRNIKIEKDSEIKIEDTAATLTLNGIMNGPGGFTKSGAGKIYTTKIHSYQGPTVLKGGVYEINGADAINAGLGEANILKLQGGTFKTTGGKTADYEYYYMPIEVADSTESTFDPFRNCYIKSKVSGTGTLNFNINYVREYIQGDWSEFSGVLKANAVGTASDGVQLMLNNSNGIPNARVVVNGKTKIVCWKNASTLYLGGLSGPSTSFLSGSDKQNNAATMTWIIGGAGTDETFAGIINNECSNASYKGVNSIVKDGTGYWKLTGNNIYSGTTTVKAGTLIVNGQHTGTAKTTVMTEARLAGRGRLSGQVEIQAGGTIQPGDPSGTSLNVSSFSVASLVMQPESFCNMEIAKSLNVNDKIAATGTVALNGTLNLSITGNLVDGDSFTLFTGTGISGQFTKIVPETPGVGLKWQWNGGILKVVDEHTALKSTTESEIKIIHNQFTNESTVSVPDNKSLLRIFSSTGTEIAIKQLNSGINTIDMHNYPKGMYNFVVEFDGKEYQQKMIR